MTDVFARVGGTWVGATGDPNNPPDPSETLFAGHEPGRVILGMAASETSGTALTYDDAYALTGTVYERRKFYNQNAWPISQSSLSSFLINSCDARGQIGWLSSKITNNDWSGAAGGDYDSIFQRIINIAIQRDADGRAPFMYAVHHEPAQDGTIATWGAMNLHLSEFFAPYKDILTFSCIGNGWWFSPRQWSQADIDAGMSQEIIDTFRENQHIIAVDTYDSAQLRPDDRASVKMLAFIDYMRERNCGALGFGEFGTETGAELTECWNVLANNCDITVVANYFNSGENTDRNYLLVPDGYVGSNGQVVGTVESEARLDQFKAARTLSVDPNPATL